MPAMQPSEDFEEEEQLEEEYESETTTQSDSESLSWITWFCSLPGHEFNVSDPDFCQVTEEFIEDDFNLTGLSALVPFYKEALEMVLDVEPTDSDLKIPDVSIVESSAELLYGLIHQRYIVTRPGLAQMVQKYEAGHFGTCPRVYCNTTRVLPVGRSDLPGVDTVKLYCPSCIDVYAPPSSRFQGVDGSFFGTTLPHLLLHSYKDIATHPSTSHAVNAPNARSTTGTAKVYQPKIYGFKVSERAKSGPRMQWMRMRPKDDCELDSVDAKGRWRPTPNSDAESGSESEASEAANTGAADTKLEPFDQEVSVSEDAT